MDQLSYADLNNLIKLTTQCSMRARADGDNNTAVTYLQLTAKLYDGIAETYASPNLAAENRVLATRARKLADDITMELTSANT
jgi:hypothetical protein